MKPSPAQRIRDALNNRRQEKQFEKELMIETKKEIPMSEILENADKPATTQLDSRIAGIEKLIDIDKGRLKTADDRKLRLTLEYNRELSEVEATRQDIRRMITGAEANLNALQDKPKALRKRRAGTKSKPVSDAAMAV